MKDITFGLSKALFLSVSIALSGLAVAASPDVYKKNQTEKQESKNVAVALNHSAVASKTIQTNTDSIDVTSPISFQAFQKNKNNRQDIKITGTYTGNPTSLSASFNNGKPQVIVSSPADDSFSGTLSNQAAGFGDLKVWFTNDPSRIVLRHKIAITDVYTLIGQSNQTEVDANFNHSTPKQSSQTGPLVYNASSKRSSWGDGSENSTYVVPFGQDYYKKHGYPCAFIFAAIGGTNMASWQPDSDYSYNPQILYGNVFGIGLNLYNRAKAMIQVGSPSGVKAFLWHQGEADAGISDTGKYRTSAEKEKTQLQTLATQLNQDFPNIPVFVAKLQIIRTKKGEAVDASSIREGQVKAWNSMPTLHAGPDLSDLECTYEPIGYFHLMGDQTVSTVGHRWFEALSHGGAI